MGTEIGKGGPVLAAKISLGGPFLAADRFFRYRPPVSRVVTSNMSSTKLPLSNSSVHDTKYQWVSRRVNTQPVVSSDNIDPVRVAIKDLYDSDLVLSHGIKLKWIRNWMLA